jgi:COP9 signalosome complex subunit 1
MGNRDLGDFFWATGDYTQSLRYYVKSREASTSTQHVLEFALTTIRLLLEYNDYAHISNYIYKAEAALAPTDQSKEAKKAPIPAAGSAAAAAAAASANNTDRDKAMAKLDLAAGIAYLGQGNFSKAAFAFSKVTGKALEDWYGSVSLSICIQKPNVTQSYFRTIRSLHPPTLQHTER